MQPLNGKIALVTGVSRINGIGFGIAKKLVFLGADLFLHSFASYDEQDSSFGKIHHQNDIGQKLSDYGSRIEQLDADFSDPNAPKRLMKKAVACYGHIDILIVNHCYDTLKTLEELSADEIDSHLAVNVRATLLLIQSFVRQYDGRPGGRIILLTSGQHLGPMPHMAYVASKGALHQLTSSMSDYLIEKSITVNTINPGPTRTFDPSRETDEAVLKKMPLGRWGEPDDAANLIGWLVSDDALWITGQVINSEGGFRRG